MSSKKMPQTKFVESPEVTGNDDDEESQNTNLVGTSEMKSPMSKTSFFKKYKGKGLVIEGLNLKVNTLTLFFK